MNQTCEDHRPAVGSGSAAEIAVPGVDRRWVTAALMLVMVLASMEQTVTSTAMPTIIGSLHGLEHYSWVASIYLLACTVTMPLYGRLADVLGRKRVILFAIALFCVSSLLASTARSMPQLIVFRGLQGLGAGGIMPVVLTILGDIFTIEERAKIQGLFSAVWGTASLAGPALGWFLVATAGWRSIFYVNLPLGAIAMIVLAYVYRDQEKPHSVRLDLPGAVSMSVACMALLLLVSRLGPGGWSPMHAVEMLVLALASIIYFIRHERNCPDPIMAMDLLSNRSIGPSLAGSCLLGIGFLSMDTFVPLYVQGARGGGAGSAAWAVTPVMLTWATSGIIAAPMVVRFGFRKVALVGSTLVVAGFIGLNICAALGVPRMVLAMVLAITGLGLGPSSMCYLLAAQNAVNWQQRGMVTSGVMFVRNIGGSVGIGVLGALFNILAMPHLHALESRGIHPAALLDPHMRAQLPPAAVAEAGHVIASSLHWVFLSMLGIAIVQVIITRWMPKRTGPMAISRLEATEAVVG
jgi:EmrB/QacA subfamily drug resistance transporter